jgi:hypothetical protein
MTERTFAPNQALLSMPSSRPPNLMYSMLGKKLPVTRTCTTECGSISAGWRTSKRLRNSRLTSGRQLSKWLRLDARAALPARGDRTWEDGDAADFRA